MRDVRYYIFIRSFYAISADVSSRRTLSRGFVRGICDDILRTQKYRYYILILNRFRPMVEMSTVFSVVFYFLQTYTPPYELIIFTNNFHDRSTAVGITYGEFRTEFPRL